MDAWEPRLRRRGYFLNTAEFEDGEVGEVEGAEGLRIRLRIVRSTPRRAPAAAGRTSRPTPSVTRSRASHMEAQRIVVTAGTAGSPVCVVRTAHATGTRRR